MIEEPPPPVEYAEFIKRFGRPDIEEEGKLIGYTESCILLKDKIKALVDPSKKLRQKFIFLTGPAGCGKTTFVKKLAKDEPKLSFFYLKSSWLLRKHFGDPETRLRLIIDEAIEKAPSLVFIDRIELICSSKKFQNDSIDKIYNLLEDELESLKLIPAKVLVVLASTDPQIRKPCYFSDEIKITLPKQQDRVDIIKHILGEYPNDLTEEQIEQIAAASHCYSYEDLIKLCDIAVTDSERQQGDGGKIGYSSMKLALVKFKPEAIESLITPCPPLKWEDIGGVEHAKTELQRSVIWPLEHREKFKKLGISSKKGALLYGPPGCSKTMLAQALATESGYNFISIKGPELFSKWVGDSEAAVRKLYRNAREIAPCIIFFDEIDGFASGRSDSQNSSVGDKVVTQLLTELNGIEPLDNVYTIAATNRPDRVDSALLRPGRLDPAIYIQLPSEQDRKEIFKVHMKPLALDFEEQSLELVVDKLVAQTSGYSGAEVANVCQVAGVISLCESLDNECIKFKHFEKALDQVKPKTRPEDLKAYEKFHMRNLQIDTALIQASLSNLVLH